jgi:hypothetical protein
MLLEIRGRRTFHNALPMMVPLSGGTVRIPSIVCAGFSSFVAVALAGRESLA